MELRHLDVLVAVAESGSFTAAAERLHTVQSNVSEQVRQLERDIGVPLLIRSRKGAATTEFGEVVLERARRIRAEIDAMLADVSMLRGLEGGHSSIGVIGTASKWLVPALLAYLEESAPGVRLRVTEGASERLIQDVAGAELALAVVTEPVSDARLAVTHLRDEALVAVVRRGARFKREPVPLQELAERRMILPPRGNPLRDEIEDTAAEQGLTLNVPIEVEGVRLINDLVAAGQGVSILPQTAAPRDVPSVRDIGIADLPPRRLALVYSRNAYLSLADEAVREAIVHTVAQAMPRGKGTR
ncbi:MAG: LysR family transcriptional regulator [Actinobacteria bacterium]|nr:LysR family transcriptional regulator [Actinomycetota bacterium]